MLKYLKKYWFFALLAPLFMVGEIAMDLIQPDLMKTIVDEGVGQGNLQLIIDTGVRMIVLVLIGGSCGLLCGVFANLCAQNFANDLRKDLFKKNMDLSFGQTDKISTGSLVTRLTNDVTQVQNMVQMAIRGLVRNTFMFFGGIIMLYRQSPKFALIACIGLPFVISFMVFFMKKASPMFSDVQNKLDGINNVMQEDVAGARVVKAYVKEDYELGRFDRANDLLCTVNLKVQKLLAYMNPCMNIVLNLCIIAVLYVGGITVNADASLTPGKVMAAITYLSLILHGITFMANIFQTFTRAKASVDRINEVFSCPVIMYDGGKTPDENIKGKIEFKNVSFAYPNSNGQKVLDGVSFSVGSGETLGIIGATGCGKSSLVNLIPRFYDATEGEVFVDGQNVKDYDAKVLRDKIAVVMQKAELYSRPIEANIRWGKRDATPFEIKKAAEISQADDFICSTENGYYTQVAEGGHSLSGGQKQRISISRAVLKNSEILIFDDATSALDLMTEAKLYKALKAECPDVTKVIIAQRIASIKDADRIIVLDKGSISEIGTHDELLEKSEIYRDIYNSQLKEGDMRDA